MLNSNLIFTGSNILYSILQISLLVSNINITNNMETINVLFTLYELFMGVCYFGYSVELYRDNQTNILYFAILVENIVHFIIGFLYCLQIKFLNDFEIAIITFYVSKIIATYCTFGCLYSYSTRKIPQHTLDLFAKKITLFSLQNAVELQADCCAICLDEYTLKSTIGQLACGHYFHMMCLKSCKILHCPTCRQTMDTAINYHASAVENV